MSFIEDIEDILPISEEDVRKTSTDVIKSKVNIKNFQTKVFNVESYVPGTHKIHIQTWGCSHNSSDSEYMAGLLSAYGYQVTLQGCCVDPEEIVIEKNQPQTDPKMDADLWILNSCTVKNPAEDHFRNQVEEARKYDKKLVVAGCVPQGQPGSGYLQGVSVVGVQQIDRVVEVVEQTLVGNSVRLLAKKREDDGTGKKRRLGGASLALPKIRRNPRIEILPVNTGCLNACTYCKTKHARGQLGSYSPDEIVARLEQAFGEGVKEIWLTSEDLGAYGLDIKSDLASLLDRLVARIPAGCMLRLGMTNPPYILAQLDRIATILAHPRVYGFLHVPVQSGSDAVLGEMKREYTRDEFCRVVDTILQANSPGGVTVATDLICGFPTETDSDFEHSLELVKRYKFPVLFTNQFFPRPGTPAAKMERVASSAEVKKRTKQVHTVFHSYQPYSGREGSEVRVLVTEMSTDGKHLVGHTKAYEQVLLPLLPRLMGTVVLARVTSTTKHCMIADQLLQEDLTDVVERQTHNTPTQQHTSSLLPWSMPLTNWSSSDRISAMLFSIFAVLLLARIMMSFF